MAVDNPTTSSSLVSKRRMLVKNEKYLMNEDGTIMTPAQLYRHQRAKTDGFDVDGVPSEWGLGGQIAPIHKSNYSKDKYVDLAKYAIDSHNRKPNKGKGKLEFVEILKAMYQCVAGSNYYLTFTVRNVVGKGKKTHQAASLKTRTCQAIVHHRWDDSRQLISFRNAKGASSFSNGELLASDPKDETSSFSNGEPLASDPKDGTSPVDTTTNSDSETFSSSDLSEHLLHRHEIRANRPISSHDATVSMSISQLKSVSALLQQFGVTVDFNRQESRWDRSLRLGRHLRLVMGILDYQGEFEKVRKAFEERKISLSPDERSTNYSIVKGGESSMLEHDSSSRKRKKFDDEDLDSHLQIDWLIDYQFYSGNQHDNKPVSGCSLSHDGKMVATCDSSSFATVDEVHILKGHKKSLTDVAFSPSEEHIATASVDQTAKLWKPKKKGWSCVKTFIGHEKDLARIAFHPSGNFLGTASLDNTWRLWDIDTGFELLRIGGHDSRRIAFHNGGSLAASCGMDDAVARCWDLRSGKGIFYFEGHDKPILGISFSPNGYHLATGGKDNALQIWDLRKGRSLISIVAHSDIISQVKFEPQEGSYLFTGSHDKTVKVWSSRDFGLVRTLFYNAGELTAFDVVKDAQFAVTAHHRKVTLWSAKKY